MWLTELFWKLYYTWFHYFYKWFIHIVTGRCELQRILSGTQPGANRTYAIESSLRLSKQLPDLEKTITDPEKGVDDAVCKIITVKKITLSHKTQNDLKDCLSHMVAYQELIKEVETLRKIPFMSDYEDHEAGLIKLWELLMPGVPLTSRISKQWGDIGFQGDDPATDFRGMGMLGMHNLLYFVEKYNATARKLLSHSHHPKYGYSFAIVGINLTHLALQLLNSGHLKTHLYNVFNTPLLRPLINHFHQVYCHLFVEFDEYWLSEKPKDIMEFNRIREQFHVKMIEKLANRSTVLKNDYKSESFSKGDTKN